MGCWLVFGARAPTERNKKPLPDNASRGFFTFKNSSSATLFMPRRGPSTPTALDEVLATMARQDRRRSAVLNAIEKRAAAPPHSASTAAGARSCPTASPQKPKRPPKPHQPDHDRDRLNGVNGNNGYQRDGFVKTQTTGTLARIHFLMNMKKGPRGSSKKRR